jgi:murein DD-endopeptidase MepM/ murein hydrolase activator NlpD
MKWHSVFVLCAVLVVLTSGGCRIANQGADNAALSAESKESTKAAGGLWIIALRDTVFKRAGSGGKQSSALVRHDKCWVAKGSRLLLDRIVTPADRGAGGHARVVVKAPYQLRSIPHQFGFEKDNAWEEILKLIGKSPTFPRGAQTSSTVADLADADAEVEVEVANDADDADEEKAVAKQSYDMTGEHLKRLLPTTDKFEFGNGFASCPFREGDIYEGHWRGAVLEPEAPQPIATAVPDNQADALESSRQRPGWMFPVPTASAFCEGAGGGAGGHGARRSRGGRKHAGCDLYTKKAGHNVLAVANGTVIKPEYLFYCMTTALEVKNDDGHVVRYGELAWGSARGLRAGTRVKKGQLLGKTGRLSCYFQSMLHFEVYNGNASGALTNARRSPYFRRADLINPTSLLRAAHQRLGGR